jgi:predicted flap endonuclease-1-like 5' DNA nuclease
MTYLIQQILGFLVVALAIGGIVGWFIGRSGMAALQETIADLQAQLAAKKTGTPIEAIEGIGPGFGGKLRADGIDTIEKLLTTCATDEGVAEVCKCVDLDETTVRNWATMADLMRIKGLGGQWAELMWRSGISSVQDLASQEVAPLRLRFREVNDAEHRVAELPGENRVTGFIDQARSLDPVLQDTRH